MIHKTFRKALAFFTALLFTMQLLTIDGGVKAREVHAYSTMTTSLGARSIKLIEPPMEYFAGTTFTLKAQVNPPDAADKRVLWETSDARIATVNESGSVKLIAPGEVSITAKSGDGVIKTVITFTVKVDMRVPDNGEIDVKTVVPSDSYVTTEFFADDYVKMYITGETLKIDFKTITGKDDWVFTIADASGDDRVQQHGSLVNGAFSATAELGKLAAGMHTVNFYLKKTDEKKYMSTVWGIPLSVADGQRFFLKSPMEEHNRSAEAVGQRKKPDAYLSTGDLKENEKAELTELAKQITEGEHDAYKQLRLVHDWVSENIYYNRDAYVKGEYGDTTPYGTYKNKTSVCQGYSELTNMLLRLNGIPSRVVAGYALDPGEDWAKVQHAKANHAWNEAYVNGRWIILDTTWDSSNKLTGGEFIYGGRDYTYFDPTLAAFSRDHKITEYMD